MYCCLVNALHCAALNVIPVTRDNCTADDHNTPGWNDIIKAAHSDARDALKFLVTSSKPRQGEVFDSMRIFRANLLRKCRREEATIRADILASDLSNNDSTLFWKHVSKQNGSLKLADTVGGAISHLAIDSMWNDH